MHRQTSIYSIRGKRVRRASHQGEPVPVEVTRTKVQKVKHIWRKLRTSYTYRLRIAYSVGLLWAYMMLVSPNTFSPPATIHLFFYYT